MPDDTVLLERHFDTAFAAPDGIQKLRELILTLAMQGKLVPQDPKDQPASELLKAIEVQKQRLVKEGKIKQSKPLPEIKPEEVPYKLPDGWKWVRFDHIAENSKNALKAGPFGSALKKSMYVPIGFKIYGQEQVISGDEKFGDYFIDDIKYSSLESCAVKPGDILISLVGTIGKVLVLSESCQPGIINPRLVKISLYSDINREFIKPLLGSPLIQMELSEKSHGGTMNILNLGLLRDLLLPLPPKEEQRRIVAKIDRLMARCDELEKLRAERNQKRITVHTAALNRLLNAKESNDFSTAWRFITQHFGELYSVKENVAELRKAILQLAVMGKLVPQDPTDEPASELLRAIANEKQQLVKEGKIKKTKIVTPIEQSNVPFPLPDAWIWAPTEALCDIIVDCPHSTPIFTASGFVCLDTNVFKNGALIPHKIRYVSEETYLERIQRLVPQAGDVVFAREGSVGESVIIPEGMDCCLGQRVMLFRLARYVLPTYFRLALSERSSLSRLLDLHKGIGAKHVNVLDMRNALIPLPPLAEQHRIVAKINQLMALCDHLDQQIDAATNKQSALLNAVMAQV